MSEIVHVGVPPKGWESWESRLVCFHHFLDISSKTDRKVLSPRFSCFDHEWRLIFYPGGKKGSRDGRMALFLRHCSASKFTAKLMLMIRDTSGKVLVEKTCDVTYSGNSCSDRGWQNFAKREKIINSDNKVLSNGTLTIEVRIKPGSDHNCLNFIPKNAFAKNMLRSFMDENTADMAFEVQGQGFPAHKVVLQFCAEGSTLATLCEDYDESTPVPILGIAPKVFRQLLYYIYGGNIEAATWKDCAKDFIDAADRCGVKSLKIEAEAWYVKHLKLTAENAIEALLYADEKNCFLLKEVAMNFILENSKEVLVSDSFASITESHSILRETITVAARMGMRCSSKKKSEDQVDLSVNGLRALNYMNGNDIDGPRNQLIAQLGL